MGLSALVRPATRAGASRTGPEPQETVPHAAALAPAAQPRPAPPGRALPAAHDIEGVDFARRLTVGNSAAPAAGSGFQLVVRSRADQGKSSCRFCGRPRRMPVAPGGDLAIEPRSETRFCF